MTLLAGTDVAGIRIPGFGMHDELALLVALLREGEDLAACN